MKIGKTVYMDKKLWDMLNETKPEHVSRNHYIEVVLKGNIGLVNPYAQILQYCKAIDSVTYDVIRDLLDLSTDFRSTSNEKKQMDLNDKIRDIGKNLKQIDAWTENITITAKEL